MGEQLHKPSCHASAFKVRNIAHQLFSSMRKYETCLSQQRRYLFHAKYITVTYLTGHALLIQVLI